jgi:hypothetical protein
MVERVSTGDDEGQCRTARLSKGDVAEWRKAKVVDRINNGLALFNERNRARALEWGLKRWASKVLSQKVNGEFRCVLWLGRAVIFGMTMYGVRSMEGAKLGEENTSSSSWIYTAWQGDRMGRMKRVYGDKERSIRGTSLWEKSRMGRCWDWEQWRVESKLDKLNSSSRTVQN